jgi:hypothetical protein
VSKSARLILSPRPFFYSDLRAPCQPMMQYPRCPRPRRPKLHSQSVRENTL